MSRFDLPVPQTCSDLFQNSVTSSAVGWSHGGEEFVMFNINIQTRKERNLNKKTEVVTKYKLVARICGPE
jgi:hypothetical protein